TGGFTKTADAPPVTGTTTPPFSTLLSSTPPFLNTTVTTNNSSAAAAPSASAPSPTTAPSPSLPPPSAPAPSHARSGLALAVSLGTPRTDSLPTRPVPGSLGSDVGVGVGVSVSVSATSSLGAGVSPAGGKEPKALLDGDSDTGGLVQNEQQKGQTQQQMQVQQEQQQPQEQVFQLHPQERIAFLRQSGRYIAEIAASKLEAAAPLASLSIHLVALAVWKEALTLSHDWAATSATSANSAPSDTYNGGAYSGDAYNGGAYSGSGGMIPVRRSSSVGGHGGGMVGHGGGMGGHGGGMVGHGGGMVGHGGGMGGHGGGLGGHGGSMGGHGGGEEAAAAMACDLVEAEFLAAVETAEVVAAAVDRDDPSPVPDALEIVYQTALIAGRSAAVEELMGNMASATAAYARSATLFAFLLHLAPRLPISPPLRLSPADRHRLTKYHDGPSIPYYKHCTTLLYSSPPAPRPAPPHLPSPPPLSSRPPPPLQVPRWGAGPSQALRCCSILF
ncbi:unnamed protein product, partial [Closterium sp. NIES-54]